MRTTPFNPMAVFNNSASLSQEQTPYLIVTNIRCTALRQSPIILYPGYGILTRGPLLSLPRSLMVSTSVNGLSRRNRKYVSLYSGN